MVENKHGLGSILSFSAKSVNPKILEALLVGREKLVNQLENRVKNIAKDGLNHQVLIVGARGTGKTHMLSVLHHRIQPFIAKEKIKVAYFAEEEYGISGYLDFMVRILNAFIRWNEEDAEFLREQLSILQETPNSHQEETIKRIINDYVGGKPLLILIENFNDILGAIKKDGQSKLRNWLQQNERISIIATSQALSEDIGKEDKPFYGFFDEINLKSLTLSESLQLLKSLAKIEGKKDLIKHLESKGEAQVKAINTLVKGNHRLLITFYEFLKSDILSNLSVLFIKTLNDLKPYFETFIRYQPPQQQKIIRFLALAKKPQKGVEIARECFIDQKSLSKQLSELSRKKLIEILPNPKDKRNKLYDIAEPLLRISIEIGEQKEGISALFIDFLALYYNQNELENQKKRFSKILKDCISPKEKEQYFFEVDARDRALKIQKSIENSENEKVYSEVLKLLVDKKYKKVEELLKSDHLKGEIYYFIFAMVNYNKKEYDEAIHNLKEAIKSNPNREHSYVLLGRVYTKIKQHEKALFNFKKAVKLNPDFEASFVGLGHAYRDLNQFGKAINSYEKAIEINQKKDINHIFLGEIYIEQKNFKKAIESYEKAIEINPINQHSHLSLALIYSNYLDDYEMAIKYAEKTIEINSGNEEAYLLLAFSFSKIKKYKEALILCEKGLVLNQKEIIFHVIQTIIYKEKNQYKKLIPIYYKIISLGIEYEFLYDYKEEVTEAFIGILKHQKNISIEDCMRLEHNIIKDFKNPKELQIPLLLLQTFRKVILENKEEALYELSKEQREFFNENIVAFREKFIK